MILRVIASNIMQISSVLTSFDKFLRQCEAIVKFVKTTNVVALELASALAGEVKYVLFVDCMIISYSNGERNENLHNISIITETHTIILHLFPICVFHENGVDWPRVRKRML